MQSSIDQLSLRERLSSPTPDFFKKLRLTGLVLAAVSATVLGSSVAVPPLLTQLAGYLALAGSVLAAVSQTAVQEPLSLVKGEKGGSDE